MKRLLSSALGNRQEVTITGVGDSHHSNTEEFSGGSSQGHVRTGEMVNRGFGQHGVVLELRLPQWGTVAGDQHELG